MAASITKGQTFSSTETITNTKLHNLVDLATISGIVNAEIASNASIADTKLAGITTAGTVSGSSLTGLASIPSAAGLIPAANITTLNYAAKGANSDITSLTGLTTPLSEAQGGTGATSLPTTSLGSWVDKSASYGAQQASTDGFVCAYGTSAQWSSFSGYTDANANPTTQIARVYGVVTGEYPFVYAMFPVKKNDYWKIVVNVINGASATMTVYWIPLGS
uniref:Putative tail protein n=2 Tax=viral metagenome TaxID=1070528 RepID=A0A6H1ZPW8_9ZZZZ